MNYNCIEVRKILCHYITFILIWAESWTQHSGKSSAHSREIKGSGLGWATLNKSELDRTDLGRAHLGHGMVGWVGFRTQPVDFSSVCIMIGCGKTSN